MKTRLILSACLGAALLSSAPAMAMSFGELAVGVLQEMANTPDAQRPRAKQVRSTRAEPLWVVISSRESAAEAVEVAQGFVSTIGPCLVVQSRNGRFAVVAGTLNRDRSKINMETLKVLRLIPGDSFLSDGANLDTIVWSSFEANASMNLMTQPVLRQSVSMLQRSMAALNLYRGPIDGKVGISTVDAFGTYRSKFGLSADVLDSFALSSLAQTAADGFPNDSERRYAQSLGFENATAYTEATTGGFSSASAFNQARSLGFRTNNDWQEARSGGFQDGNEFMRAKAGGFENARSYQEGQEKGFATARELAAFKSSGFQDADQYREAMRAGFSSKSAFDQAQAENLKTARAEAKILLADADAFLRLNRDIEGILPIAAEASTLNGLVVSGGTDTVRSSTQRLGLALKGLSGFDAFKQARASERSDERRRLVADLKREITGFSAGLTGWVAANLTSSKTGDIVAELTLVNEALGRDDPEVLAEAKNRVTALIDRQRLQLDIEPKKADDPGAGAASFSQGAATLASITPANAFLLQGAPDDVVIAYNSGTRAPSITRNLLGAFSFTTGKASVCLLGIEQSPSLTRAFESELARFGAKTLRIDRGDCSTYGVEKSDLLILKRKRFLETSPTTAIDVLEALDRGDLRSFDEVTFKHLEEIQMAEVAISKRIGEDVINDARNGFGALMPVNGSGRICAVVDVDRDAHSEMLQRLSAFAMSQFETAAPVAFTTLDDAFQAARKNDCSMVYASQPSLKAIGAALARDGHAASYAPIWLETKDLDAAIAAVKKARESDTSEAEARRVAAELERQMAEKKSAAAAADKQAKEVSIRAESGATASALQNSLAAGLKAQVMGQPSELRSGEEKTLAGRVRDAFPEFTAWAGALAGDSWSPIGVDTTISDFGIMEWKERKLEAIVLEVKVKIVSAERGEYREDCRTLGWIWDGEFNLTRDPIEMLCAAPGRALADWKIGHRLESRWVAQ